jgi:hypothetical protein
MRLAKATAAVGHHDEAVGMRRRYTCIVWCFSTKPRLREMVVSPNIWRRFRRELHTPCITLLKFKKRTSSMTRRWHCTLKNLTCVCAAMLYENTIGESDTLCHVSCWNWWFCCNSPVFFRCQRGTTPVNISSYQWWSINQIVINSTTTLQSLLLYSFSSVIEVTPDIRVKRVALSKSL